MNTREPRRPMRGYVRDSRRRKMPLNVDLNDIPPSENRATTASEETSATRGGAQTSEQGRGGGGEGGVVPPPATIDLEAIDDEVVISSPRSFAEARSKSRRNQEVVVLGEGVPHIRQSNSEEVTTRLTLNGYNTRKRRANPSVINCDQYVILEDRDTKKRNVKRAPEPLPSAPPPKEPTFSCPVCMGPLVEEMSTKCGHIFCTKCIKAAIAAQSKCPTCRRKLSMRDTIRVYLPATDGA